MIKQSKITVLDNVKMMKQSKRALHGNSVRTFLVECTENKTATEKQLYSLQSVLTCKHVLQFSAQFQCAQIYFY